MIAIEHTLHTRRLRLEPMTMSLARAAAAGGTALADALDADIPHEWAPGGLRLLSAVRRAGWTAPAPTRAIVVHKADERVIGDVRFEPAPLMQDTVEIGYGIVPLYRKQGYATEAMGRIIDWLLAEGGVGTVIAGCDMKNRGSVRTLRKLGFLLDGARRPGAYWWVLAPGMRLPTGQP